MTILGSTGVFPTPTGVRAHVRPVEMEPLSQKQPIVGILSFESTMGLEAFAEDLSHALRHRYTAAHHAISEAKSLTEIKLVFCDGDERPECLAKAGKTLGAHQLIYGNVRADGRGGRILAVTTLNVEKGSIEQAFDISLPPSVDEAAKLVYTRLTEQKVPATTVQPRADAPSIPPEQPDVYVAPSDQQNSVSITHRHSQTSYRTYALISGGVAIVTAAVGGFFLYRGEQQEREANKLIGASTTTDSSGGRHFTNEETERTNRPRIAAKESAAERDSTIGIMGLGVGGASLIATGVFAYLGWRKIQPQVGVQEGGMSAGLVATFE